MTARERLSARDTAERHERVRTGWRVARALVEMGWLMGLGRYCPHHPDDLPLTGPLFRCWRCQHERRRRTQEARQRVRRPPRLLLPQRRGRCRLCASTALQPGRIYWCSQRCVDLWSLATNAAVQRHHLELVTGDRCARCGHAGGCEVDHVRPLWSLTDHERGELRWWLPFNLQLLCERCHKAKTSREAAERAALRRGQLPILLAVAS